MKDENKNIIEVVISRNKIPIRLTYKQWAHTVENHDYMSGNFDLVLETIADPDYIVRGWTDELIALKHYPRTSISEKYVVVVYKENQKGFMITAFMASKKEKILKRGITWQRQKK